MRYSSLFSGAGALDYGLELVRRTASFADLSNVHGLHYNGRTHNARSIHVVDCRQGMSCYFCASQILARDRCAFVGGVFEPSMRARANILGHVSRRTLSDVLCMSSCRFSRSSFQVSGSLMTYALWNLSPKIRSCLSQGSPVSTSHGLACGVGSLGNRRGW